MAVLAQSAGVSVPAVTLAQTIRVMVVVVLFPPLITWLAPRGGAGVFFAERPPVELFGLARELNTAAEGIEIGPSPTDVELAQDLALPIEDLDLTIRSYNCLKREGIHTVGELVVRSEADLLDIRNFGAKSIVEVKEKLAGLGLSLKDSPADFDPTLVVDAFDGDDADFDENFN